MIWFGVLGCSEMMFCRVHECVCMTEHVHRWVKRSYDCSFNTDRKMTTMRRQVSTIDLETILKITAYAHTFAVMYVRTYKLNWSSCMCVYYPVESM